MTALDMAHVRHAPGQPVKPCPRCSQALVYTGDDQWAHAIGVEPCGAVDADEYDQLAAKLRERTGMDTGTRRAAP